MFFNRTEPLKQNHKSVTYLLPCISLGLVYMYILVGWRHINPSYAVVLQTGEIGEEWTDLQYNTEYEYSRDLNTSSEVSNSTWHYLKIKNTTSLSSGTYACIIRSPVKNANQTSTVTLKVTDCPEDAKLQKYRTELVMLCSLGFFYLLLIFFACICLKKDGSSGYQKAREKHIDNSRYLVSTC
ncbi:CD83 antigen [Zootoca vivipara]|uniref:CD83 antigen n=1 Tax=Zootoca vivipara TaxID=8524 RepID=UPI00293C053D|nr:CD83 antigen [Zootoca vivipara]